MFLTYVIAIILGVFEVSVEFSVFVLVRRLVSHTSTLKFWETKFWCTLKISVLYFNNVSIMKYVFKLYLFLNIQIFWFLVEEIDCTLEKKKKSQDFKVLREDIYDTAAFLELVTSKLFQC